MRAFSTLGTSMPLTREDPPSFCPHVPGWDAFISLLVIIGVKPDGSKERVAIGDGYRETKASWLELLLDLKARGLQAGPRLAVGDG